MKTIIWKCKVAVFNLLRGIFGNTFPKVPRPWYTENGQKNMPPLDMRAQVDMPIPMKWNYCADGPCYYFMDFYVSSRYWNRKTSRMEQHFNEEVNRFKDWGNTTVWYSYLQAIKSLKKKELLVVFMPCSTQERYMKRWAGLSSYLHQYGIRTGLNMIRITKVRQIAHFNNPDVRRIVRNYEISIPKGSMCVIIDDVRTTGSSCADLADAIRNGGSFTIGAVVMAQVPQYDRNLRKVN